jgi:hypothetical protein
MFSVIAVAQNSLLHHGEGLAFVGTFCGLIGLFFGQGRFEPSGRNAQYGRWRAARLLGLPFIILGLIGLVLIAVAEA